MWRYAARWIVHRCDRDASTSLIVFGVDCKGVTGENLTIKTPANRLRVAPIEVTTNPALKDIMLHEFCKPVGNECTFDPGPANEYIQGLSSSQVKLLSQYPMTGKENRLVIFITIYKKNTLRMGADLCEWSNHKLPNRAVKPNASFAVFHCKGNEKPVELVCLTNHFYINPTNTGKGIAITPKNQQRTRNDVAKIACRRPDDSENCVGSIWFYLPEIMTNNYIHGMINTDGCWMLFRNFNWPAERYSDFDRVYRLGVRRNEDRLVNCALRALDYGVTMARNGRSNSEDKFRYYDRNYAYLWFLHDVVGIEYFSKEQTEASWRRKHINRYRAPRCGVENTFPLNSVNNLDKLCCYNIVHREQQQIGWKLDDSVWKKNVLNFQTASGFDNAWADIYFFKEDGAELKAYKDDNDLTPLTDLCPQKVKS